MSSNETTEKIEQLVFDENKIVTYKLLSSELSVHVNKAKQLLNEYITDHCVRGNNDLNVYYAVSGFQKYNGQKIHKLAVVSKNELEEIKKGFSALSSIHIYSIQKSSSLDECALYTSDYLLANSSDEPNVFSAIRHPNLQIKENRVLRNVESNSDNKKTTVESQAARKTEQKPVPAQKTNALFSAWQKKEQKNKTLKEQNGLPPAALKNDDNTAPEKNSRSPLKASKVADKGNKNNIMNMFSKQAVKSTSKANTQNSEKSVSQNNISNETEKEEKLKQKPKEEEGERARHIEAVSKKKETSRKKRQKQKRSHEISEDDSDDEWEKPKKKRKRIVAAFSDSDSESEEEKKDRAQRNLMDSESPVKIESNGIEEDEEEPIPPTPEEEPLPSALVTSATNGKGKKLKTVSKTFQDEDGFLVTRKVKEYVTDSEGSDNEAASHVKVPPKAAPKPDIKKNFVNKKQSSLMSFFKQK